MDSFNALLKKTSHAPQAEMNFSPQARVTDRSPLSRRLTVTILIFLLDLTFNAAAGCAAAVTGAKVNSWSNSSSAAPVPYDILEIASLGAKTGLFKAGVLAVWHFGTAYGGLAQPIAVVFAMASSMFGVAALVTCFVSTLVLGTVNDSFIRPALIASLFIGSETASAAPPPGMNLTSPFFDAFAGLLFAILAQREGLEICSNAAGLFAGLVYGLITTLKSVLIVLARGPTVSYSSTSRSRTTTKVQNNFESYTVIDPGGGGEEGVFTTSRTFLGQAQNSSFGSSYSIGREEGTELFVRNQRVG